MQNVKIQRTQLLEVVKTNRSKHRDLFLKAQEGYRHEVIAQLDQMLAEARDNKRIRRVVELDEPVDQTNEYDRVISMLEMSVDDTVTLTAHEFDAYVRDRWTWSAHALANNTKYLART
jgi:hypothetical protein